MMVDKPQHCFVEKATAHTVACASHPNQDGFTLMFVERRVQDLCLMAWNDHVLGPVDNQEWADGLVDVVQW